MWVCPHRPAYSSALWGHKETHVSTRQQVCTFVAQLSSYSVEQRVPFHRTLSVYVKNISERSSMWVRPWGELQMSPHCTARPSEPREPHPAAPIKRAWACRMCQPGCWYPAAAEAFPSSHECLPDLSLWLHTHSWSNHISAVISHFTGYLSVLVSCRLYSHSTSLLLLLDMMHSILLGHWLHALSETCGVSIIFRKCKHSLKRETVPILFSDL